MRKSKIVILFAGFLSTNDIFCSGLLSNMWNVARGILNQQSNSQQEGLKVLQDAHLGAAYNVFTDNDRCVHVHNAYFSQNKADKIETMVIWYPYFDIPMCSPLRFSKLKNIIVKCPCRMNDISRPIPNVEQIRVFSQRFDAVCGNALKQLYVSLFSDMEPNGSFKINVVIPEKPSNSYGTTFNFSAQTFFPFLRRCLTFDLTSVLNFIATPSIKMYDFVAQMPRVVPYNQHDYRSASFFEVPIESALRTASSWFKEGTFNNSNIFQNPERVIVQQIIDDPIKTLAMINETIKPEIIN